MTRDEERVAQQAMTELTRGEARAWHNEQLGDMRIRPLNDPYPAKDNKVCRDYTVAYYGNTTYMVRAGWRDAGARRACRIKDIPTNPWESND